MKYGLNTFSFSGKLVTVKVPGDYYYTISQDSYKAESFKKTTAPGGS